jgi:hypothetical protein
MVDAIGCVDMTNDWDEQQDTDANAEDEFGPGSADYDLSERHGYDWEQDRREDADDGPIPRWALTWVTVTVVGALVLPALILIWRYG